MAKPKAGEPGYQPKVVHGVPNQYYQETGPEAANSSSDRDTSPSIPKDDFSADVDTDDFDSVMESAFLSASEQEKAQGGYGYSRGSSPISRAFATSIGDDSETVLEEYAAHRGLNDTSRLQSEYEGGYMNEDINISADEFMGQWHHDAYHYLQESSDPIVELTKTAERLGFKCDSDELRSHMREEALAAIRVDIGRNALGKYTTEEDLSMAGAYPSRTTNINDVSNLRNDDDAKKNILALREETFAESTTRLLDLMQEDPSIDTPDKVVESLHDVNEEVVMEKLETFSDKELYQSYIDSGFTPSDRSSGLSVNFLSYFVVRSHYDRALRSGIELRLDKMKGLSDGKS